MLQEFLLNNYLFITHFVEILAAVVGLFCLKKYKETVARYFVWILVYVAIIELISSYPNYLKNYEFLSPIKFLVEGTKFEKNYWWATIFWSIGGAMFYSFYFQKIIKSKRNVKLLKYLVLLFIVSSLVYILTHWDAFFTKTFPFIKIFGVSIILIGIVFYLIEMLRSEKMLIFYKSINFYIGAVLFIWILITTPLVFYDVYFSRQDMDYVMLKATIYISCNIFMYLSFTLALIWCKPQNV